MNYQYDRKHSTDNEFEDCYPNEINPNTPSLISHNGPRSKVNSQKRYYQESTNRQNFMEGVNRDYDDVHKSRQPNLYGKNSFGYSKNEDEIRQRHKHHDLSDQIVEHDISSYEINRNLSNKPSNNQDTRLKKEYNNMDQNWKVFEQEKSKKSFALQSDLDEQRYSAINQLLEIKRQVFDREPQITSHYGEVNPRKQKFEQGRWNDQHHESFEREMKKDYAMRHDKSAEHTDSYQESLEEQDYDEEDDGDDLTYEQIIRDDVVPQKQNQNQYYQQKNSVGPSYQQIQNNLYSAEEIDRDSRSSSSMRTSQQKPLKGLDLITLRSDFNVDYDPGFQNPTRRNEVQGEKGNLEALKQAYNQLQFDVNKRQQEKPTQDKISDRRHEQSKSSIQRSRRGSIGSFVIDEGYMNYSQNKNDGWRTERDQNSNKAYENKEWPTTLPRKNKWNQGEASKGPENYGIRNQSRGLRQNQADIQNREEHNYYSIDDYSQRHNHQKERNKQTRGQDLEEELDHIMHRNARSPKNTYINSDKPHRDNTYFNDSSNNDSQLKENTAKHLNVQSYRKAQEQFEYDTPHPYSDASSINYKPRSKDDERREVSQTGDHSGYNFKSSQDPNSYYQESSHPAKGPQHHNTFHPRPQSALSQNYSSNYRSRNISPNHSYTADQNIDQNSYRPVITSSKPVYNQEYEQYYGSNQISGDLQTPVMHTFHSNNAHINPIQQIQYQNFNSSSLVVPPQVQVHPHTTMIPINYGVPSMYSPPIVYGNLTPMHPNPPSIIYSGGVIQPAYNNPHQINNPVPDRPQINSFLPYPMPSTTTNVNYQGVPHTSPEYFTSQNQVSRANNQTNHQSVYSNTKLINNPKSDIHNSSPRNDKGTSQNIKNYIKDQEDFLKKFDDEKIKLAERLKRDMTKQSALSLNEKVSSVQPEKTRPDITLERHEENLIYQGNYNGDNKTTPNKRVEKRQNDQNPNSKNLGMDHSIEIVAKDLDLSSNKGGNLISNNFDLPSQIQKSPERDYNTKAKEVSVWKERTLPDSTAKIGRVSQSQSPISRAKFDTSEDNTKSTNMIHQEKEHMSAWRMDFPNAQGLEEAEEILGDKGLSLAEVFAEKKRDLVDKYENQKVKEEIQHPRLPRTKEDILKQRKEMMEYKGFVSDKPRSDADLDRSRKELMNQGDTSSIIQRHDQNLLSNSVLGGMKRQKEPDSELLERLATGARTKISKKDMKALTSKNYEQLPEIKKRKEEEMKKNELKKRQERVKMLDQKLRSNLNKR